MELDEPELGFVEDGVLELEAPESEDELEPELDDESADGLDAALSDFDFAGAESVPSAPGLLLA